LILVLADDFTGAAETAAVAFRYGFSAEVQTDLDAKSTSEVICLDTNTRSLKGPQAHDLLAGLLTGRAVPSALFKKVDSVLRGPVLAELVALMEILEKQRVILIPANPSLGRTIEEGSYLVGRVPIEQTDFGRDPEHPISSSKVVEILGTYGSVGAVLAKHDENLPAKGIIVGDARTKSDLKGWIRHVDAMTLLAGAADFFSVYLEATLPRPEKSVHAASPVWTGKTLFVSGSSSDYSRELSGQFKKAGVPLCRMPEELFLGTSRVGELESLWTMGVLEALNSHSVARVAVDRPLAADPTAPERLTSSMARLVQAVLENTEIEQLCVEGGATLSALVRCLGWNRLRIRAELGPGSAVMKPFEKRGPVLISKPGSYPWPDGFLQDILSSLS